MGADSLAVRLSSLVVVPDSAQQLFALSTLILAPAFPSRQIAAISFAFSL